MRLQRMYVSRWAWRERSDIWFSERKNNFSTERLMHWGFSIFYFALWPFFWQLEAHQTYLVFGPLVPKQHFSFGSVDSRGFSWLRHHGFNVQQGQSCLYIHVRSELESPIPPVVFGDLMSISWEPNDLSVSDLPKDIIPLTKDGRECVPWHWCEVVSCRFWVLLKSMFHSPCPSGCAW